MGSRSTVYVLGAFALEGPAACTPRGVQAELVKALAVLGPLHNEQVIDLLWPDCGSEAGRARLRTVLARVRRDCDALVTRNGEHLLLGPDVQVDLADFERHATATLACSGSLPDELRSKVIASLRGGGPELLPFDRYSDWTVAPRERHRRMRIAVLDRLAADAQRAGFYAEALMFLDEAIDADPLDEDRYLLAARLHLARDRRGGAQAMLRRARAVMDELGLGPSPAYAQVAALIGAAVAV